MVHALIVQIKMHEDQVIGAISKAFADVQRPAKASITRCVCEECLQIRNDFAEKDPDELPPDRMRYHSRDMVFLTPTARRYFLPRWMILGLRQPEMAYTDAALETLASCDGWDVLGGYSHEQRQSIVDFLTFVRHRIGDRYDKYLMVAWENWTDSEFEREEPEQASAGKP